MIITIEQLEKRGACHAAVTAFRTAIGEQTADVEWSPVGQYLMLGDPLWRQWWGWAVWHRIIPAWSMHGADLCGANLCGANLCGADLCGADLHGANLRGADLRWANLRWANLRWANLCGANLCGADLRWANCNECTIGIERGAE